MFYNCHLSILFMNIIYLIYIITTITKDPIKDHGLFEPTYIDALRWEGNRYIALYLPPWYPIIQITIKKSNALADIFTVAFKILLRNILSPIIAFVMIMNAWMKKEIILPIIVLFIKIWNMIMDIIRILRSGDNVYEPVIVPAATSASTSLVESSAAAAVVVITTKSK